jgi:phosphoglycolate phosphatase
MRLIAFDLDGTLVDSAPDLCFCLGNAFGALGYPQPSLASTRLWIGDGIGELVARALAHAAPGMPSAPSMAEAAALVHECYRKNLFSRSRLYPGVVTTLDELAARGLTLACVTNKRTAYATSLLAEAGIRERFAVVYGGDAFAEKKPHPRQLLAASESTGVAPSDSLMIGDSPNDLRAARAAGFSFVWAAYGYHSDLPQTQHEPQAKLERVTDLVSLFP